ncbi:MAG TPA: hypothetical protein VHM72_07260 [Solirubrobacteraceae bacterium]|nr:hypothetical protein [Solirubrobacteraceae bacterium]
MSVDLLPTAKARQFTRRPNSGGTADDLHNLADLKDRGVLTDEEANVQKPRFSARSLRPRRSASHRGCHPGV